MSFRNSAPREADSLRPVASRNEGFTLIETTIAMVVMMVVGLGATSLFLYSVRSNAGGNDRSQALSIAQQRIEGLRALAFNDPQLAIGKTTTTAVRQNAPSGASSGGDKDTYKIVLNVEGLPAGAATPTQKRLTITVTPENGYGANSWINSNPVVIVIHRSNSTTGPYRL